MTTADWFIPKHYCTKQNKDEFCFFIDITIHHRNPSICMCIYKYACMDWDRFTCYTYSVHVPVYAWFKFLIRVWYALFWLNLLHIVYLFNTKEQFILWCKSWFVDILNDMCLSRRCNSQLLHIFWINLSTVELLILFVKCFRSFDIIF